MNLNQALKMIGGQPAFSREWEDRLEARVRREVIARYGSFALPASILHPPASSFQLPASSFKLPAFSLRMFLQPAMALASIAAIAIGVGVFQLATSERGAQAPTISMSEPVARSVVVADVLPGSGIALSVFALSQNTTPTVAPAATITTKKVWRKPKALNPAAGVFTNWGTGVFSKEELMRQQAKELAVFSG